MLTESRNCPVCNRPTEFDCPYCSRGVCPEHRLPEKHSCQSGRLERNVPTYDVVHNSEIEARFARPARSMADTWPPPSLPNENKRDDREEKKKEGGRKWYQIFRRK